MEVYVVNTDISYDSKVVGHRSKPRKGSRIRQPNNIFTLDLGWAPTLILCMHSLLACLPYFILGFNSNEHIYLFSYLYHVKRGGSIYDSGIDLEVKQPSRIFLPDRYHVQGDDDRLRKTITTTT